MLNLLAAVLTAFCVLSTPGPKVNAALNDQALAEAFVAARFSASLEQCDTSARVQRQMSGKKTPNNFFATMKYFGRLVWTLNRDLTLDASLTLAKSLQLQFILRYLALHHPHLLDIDAPQLGEPVRGGKEFKDWIRNELTRGPWAGVMVSVGTGDEEWEHPIESIALDSGATLDIVDPFAFTWQHVAKRYAPGQLRIHLARLEEVTQLPSGFYVVASVFSDPVLSRQNKSALARALAYRQAVGSRLFFSWYSALPGEWIRTEQGIERLAEELRTRGLALHAYASGTYDGVDFADPMVRRLGYRWIVYEIKRLPEALPSMGRLFYAAG